eukprot:scaffold32730_cov36-Cyclotella_meneghiniana.AAC.4
MIFLHKLISAASQAKSPGGEGGALSGASVVVNAKLKQTDPSTKRFDGPEVEEPSASSSNSTFPRTHRLDPKIPVPRRDCPRTQNSSPGSACRGGTTQ